MYHWQAAEILKQNGHDVSECHSPQPNPTGYYVDYKWMSNDSIVRLAQEEQKDKTESK